MNSGILLLTGSDESLYAKYQSEILNLHLLNLLLLIFKGYGRVRGGGHEFSYYLKADKNYFFFPFLTCTYTSLVFPAVC